jgi:hippurate hydrolase
MRSLQAIYRDLHQHPELAYQEVRTANLVAQELTDLGLNPKTGIARTGVVADIVRGTGKTVALRADMDALPLHEQTGLAFSSLHSGKMHACGHDSHTTMLLGAARLLVQSKFSGTIRLVFQPAEESAADDPEQKSGAQRMLEAGVYDGVDAALALHNVPEMPVGFLAWRDHEIMGCCLDFRIVVHGKSAHAGAEPERGVDAVVVGASIVVQAQTLVSRQVAPTDSGVVSFGVIEGGTTENIVADRLTLRGTIRTLKLETAKHLAKRLELLAQGISSAHGASVEFFATPILPSTVNNPALNKILCSAALELGLQLEKAPASLGVEDFAYVSQVIPSAYAFLGSAVEGYTDYGLHHPQVRCNEAMLELGAGLLAKAALGVLLGK